MKVRKIMSAMLAAEMLAQTVPPVSMTAFAETPTYEFKVNGKSATPVVSVTYGEQIALTLSGAAEDDEVLFSYATEEEAEKGKWTDFVDDVCLLEPGKYLLKFEVTSADGKYFYTSTDEEIEYAIQVEKAKLAAPTSLAWNGCDMGWAAVTTSSTGAQAEDGAVKGYTLEIYKNGSLVGTEYTENVAYVAAFADKVLNDAAYGSGCYTFTVKAEVSDSAAAHYTSSDASEESAEYIVPLVTLSSGSGIASVSPADPFLLLPGSSYASKDISASPAATYSFGSWSGTGVSFADNGAENTTVTIDDNYSGEQTLTITALSKDNAAPEILTLSTEGDKITATAQDNVAVTEYAFAAADNAEAVTSWLTAEAASESVQSFSFTPTEGGRYRFFAKDAEGNISVSDGYIDVTMITLHGYSDGSSIYDKTSYFFGDTYALPDITREAWVFGGWHKLADLSDEAVLSVASDTENGVELYAKWTEQTLSIPALTPISKTYDAQEETLSVSISNTGVLSYQWYKDGAAIPGATSDSITVKNVADSGSYHVYVELKQTDGTVVGSGSSEDVTVEIIRAPLVVKADDDEITYGADAPESYSVDISGYVGDEGEEVVTRGTVTCGYEKGDAAGAYDIIPEGFSADNYEIEHKKGTLTVKAKKGTLTAQLADPDAEYFYALNTAHTPAVIVKDGDTLLSEGRDYELKYTDNINAGTATITVTYKGNYSGSATLHFVIKKSGITPVLMTADKIYGELDTVAWLDENPSDGAVTYYYAAADSDDFSTTLPSNAGSYKVYAVVADTSDYVGFTTDVKTFKINKRPIKITANSAVFPYDGTEHSDSGYTIEGTFVVGQGFKEVKVTGSVTDVTAPGEGVVNKITYELSPTTDPNNYDITAVDGLLEVTSLSLTVPSGLGWSSTAGTATWVPVTKNKLIVNYALDLYAYDGVEYTQINNERIIIDTNSYDFAPAIIAHATEAAAQGKTYSYTFTIQTLSAGGEGKSGYTDSEVSDYQEMMYTAEVSIASDSSMVSSASLGGTDRLILLNGQRVAINAATKDGFAFDDPALTVTEGFSVSSKAIDTPVAHKASSLSAYLTARLTHSLLGGVVTVNTVDEKPWISSFTAENAADLQSVKLSFTAADGNALTGWMISKSATAPAADAAEWNDISGQGAEPFSKDITVTEDGTYYVYVKDGSGSVVSYPASLSVYRISFAPGTGTGVMQSILKAQNTAVTLPACTFTNDGFDFQNWIGDTGIYSDGGTYSANSNDELVAGWTDEHFDYTVRYFYMNADGTYSAAPESTHTFNGVYGATITTATDDIQYARTGFELDDSAERTASITLVGSGEVLDVYYRRIKYNVYFKYTMPRDTEPTIKTVPYYYGADLSHAFDEKPSADGYNFIGWLFGSAGAQPTEMPAHDVTVTGSFTPKNAEYHIRYFTQDVDAAHRICFDSYTLNGDVKEDILSLHDDPVVFSADDAQQLSGFTFAGIAVTYGAEGGTALPEELSSSVSKTAVADTDRELYINVYYTRNTYSVKLNVWQDTVGVQDNLKYTETWTLPYEAELEKDVYPVSNIDNWPHDDDYELADYVDWSTGTAPTNMPAGDVTVTRQFVSKVTGQYKVEVYLEGETEGVYEKKSFTYYNNVGRSVSIGADSSFTINYNNYANSINYFQHYQIREVTDADIENGTITGAENGTLTTGVVTNTNNGENPLVLRIFFERKTYTSTINYYYNDGTRDDSGILCYTIQKQSKWGTNYTYNYEPLALFDGTEKWAEPDRITYSEEKAQVQGQSPTTYDFKANNYVVAYSGRYALNGSYRWPSYSFDTVESLGDTRTGAMGYEGNVINVYYTRTNPEEQYYLDVVYNPGALNHAASQEIPLTYDYEDKEYIVRVANEAMFYKNVTVGSGEFPEYPGLGAATGSYVYDNAESNIKYGYRCIEVNGKPCFLNDEEGYIYIAVIDNRFFRGNQTSFSISNGDPGYSDVLDFLDEYKRQWAATDKSAEKAAVYNRSYGTKIIYKNDKLTITFVNGSIHYIYYNLSGTICAKHEYADGAVVDHTALGCADGTFPELPGHTIGWYEDSAFTIRKTSDFTLTDSITLYGRYEKSTVICYENVYYELSDPVTVGDTKYTYITENDLAAFEGDEKLTQDTTSEDMSFVDGSGSTVTLNVQTITYKYDGEIVMIRKERPTLSFAEISMDSTAYGKTGMYYDEANSQNSLVGYCQSEPISLRAYFARYRYDVTVDPNHSDANAVVTRYNYGQHVVIEAPQRAGYDFGGWTWYKYDKISGEYVLWTSGAPVLDAQQNVSFVIPEFSVKAVANWTEATFSQQITHYFQTKNLTFETDVIRAILRGEYTASEAVIALNESEKSGIVYTDGSEIVAVSFTSGSLTYFYTNAVNEQGRYIVTDDDLAAVSATASIKQGEPQAVSDFILSVPDYSFSYVLYQYKDTIRSYINGESFDVCAGMQVDYYYKRANDLVIGAQAYITDSGSGNIAVIGGGSHYMGETLVLSARVPAGFTFLGWYNAADVLEGYPAEGTALSGYTLKADWASAAPVSASADYTLKVKRSADYVALVAADEVAEPSVTISGKDSLVYGYSASAANAVNTKVRFASDASSANYVDSYKWYRNGEVISGANSATFLIPQGWNAGEYTLTCEVTVKRRDNLRTATYSKDFTVTVSKAEIDYKADNFEGSYDKQYHSISLNIKKPDAGYVVYYSDTPLTKDNYDTGSTVKPEYMDVHVSDVPDGNGGTIKQRDAYNVYYYIKDTTGNFNDASGLATVKINPVQLTLSAGTETYFKIYDGNSSVLGTITEAGTDLYNLVRSDNVYIINGLVSGDRVNPYIISCDADFNSRHVQGANAVTLSHIQLASTTGDIIYNYIFDNEYSVKLSGYIEPLPLVVDWDSNEFVYNGSTQCPTPTITTVIPSVDSQNLTKTVSGGQKNVGVYSASVYITSTDDSTDIRDFRLQNGTCAYKIIGRPITVKPDDNTIVYDGKNHTLNTFSVCVGTLVNGDRFVAKYDSTVKNAGTYHINPINIRIYNSSGVDITDNYTITEAAGELVIERRPVTVSGITANDKDYDGNTDAVLDISAAQISNVVEGDVLSLDEAKISGAFDDAAIGTNKHVTVTYSDGALTGASINNYVLDTANSQTDAYASIGGKKITVTVKNATVTYGESASFDVELSGFLTQAELDGFDKSGITYKVGTSEQTAVPYTTTLAAGTYNIYADVSALSAENYYFSAVAGKLVVSQRKIAVEAASGADITKEYDGGVSASVSKSDYRFTAVSGVLDSGIVNGDTVNLKFTAKYNSKDVLYADKVDMTALSVDNKNYQLVTDTFAITGHITKKALTVTAKDTNVTYGATSAPTYKAEYSGFADGEDESELSGTLSFSCEYDPTVKGKREVKAGGYTITPTGLSSDNYDVSFIDGTLTVQKAEIVITAENKSATYGFDGIPTFTFTHSSPLAYGESYADEVTGDVTYSCNVQTKNDGTKDVISSKPADYAITPVVTGLTANNYRFTAADGKLTVNKYTLPLTELLSIPRFTMVRKICFRRRLC